MASHTTSEVATGIPADESQLKRGLLFILDATLEDAFIFIRFDGLKRVEGPSKIGDYHYVPMLFQGGRSNRREQRLLLEICGLLLGRVQGRLPSYGVIWHGPVSRTEKVCLRPEPREAERLFRHVCETRESGPPQLILNDHCQICEFREPCRAQAVQEDNFSLLRGLGEKEVKGYNRKGILTLTQLAHTFRPRRKGRRSRGNRIRVSTPCKHWRIVTSGSTSSVRRTCHSLRPVSTSMSRGFLKNGSST